MINKIIIYVKNYFPLILIVILAGTLRFINLGYSDYQGDEIKALFIKDPTTTYSEFFLDQRKGPGQFFITFLTRFINSDYSNEFVHRLPFALAGFFSVYFFYKLVLLYFDKKIAFYSAFFMLSNGFFIAFSRIVQYQSFTILFMILSLYYLSLSVFSKKEIYRNFFLAYIFWSFSMLFHYDGIFIAPISLYLTFVWIKNNVYKKNNQLALKTLIITLLVSGLFLFSFYIPFIINLSKNTLDYWSGRLTGDVSGKLSSSKYLFTVYQPIYVIHFYTILFILGVFYYLSQYLSLLLKKIKMIKKLLPEFIYKNKSVLLFIFWFIVPFIFMEKVVYIPGTHIYTYLMPLFVIISLGLSFINNLLYKFKKFFIPDVIFYFGLTALFTFLYLQSYTIFVDNKWEYPWEEEKFLIWQFPKPNPIYHLSMFGFPYYRNWEGIRNAIINTKNNGYYSSNERVSITRFYIPLEKDTDKAGHYIRISSPQSFSDEVYQEKAQYWEERYHPIFTFSKNGRDLVRVYYMEPGSLEEIIERGF